MARPLPKDLQREIAETATKAEVRSVAIFSFIAGSLFGACILGAVTSEQGAGLYFAGAFVLVAAYWFFSSRQRR